ncbi:MAG TPA: Mth938-like domain-containing protein [Gammaproteobacteria bacterium]|nr:Mth938-like domain-containing protein [Gammaproteobacteria bacterium]
MKIEQDLPLHGNYIRGYAPGEVRINDTAYHRSLIVTPESVVGDWRPASFEDLLAEDMQRVAEFGPDVVVLGTGESHRFPHPRLLRALYDRHIGVEIMATTAACRTYNILVAEDRPVAAALIITPRD